MQQDFVDARSGRQDRTTFLWQQTLHAGTHAKRIFLFFDQCAKRTS